MLVKPNLAAGPGDREQLTVIIRIRPKKMSEEVGVSGCVASPPLPNLIAQRISDELVLVSPHHVVGTHVGRLGIRIVLAVNGLSRQKAKMFAPEKPPQGSGMVSRLIMLSVHCAIDQLRVLHNDRKLAVVDAQLGLPLVSISPVPRGYNLRGH